MALLVGGPLHGQDIEMPSDQLTVKVQRPGSRPASYTVTRVTTLSGESVEVWGYTPLCYKKVKARTLAMMAA